MSGISTRPLLFAHARDALAHYKCPTSVNFADTFPRTTTGKVQKVFLRERYWADRDWQWA